MTESTRPDDAPEFPRDAKPWLAMLREAERRDQEYHDRCKRTDRIYACLEKFAGTDRELHVFWANQEVVQNTVFSREPVPVVGPRFKQRKDLPRKASDLIQRALITNAEMDELFETLILVRNSYTRLARAAPWVIFDREKYELRTEYLCREDFRHGPGRFWKEVTWVARAGYLTRKEYRLRFGSLPAEVEFKERDQTDPNQERELSEPKARVWELWHKAKNKVVWVADGAKEISDAQDPWMQLHTFWPMPRPVFGTVKPETLTPIPDVTYYQGQLEEINELTSRMAALTDALKAKGFYAAGAGDVGSSIEAALADSDNRQIMIPVSSFGALGSKMGDAIVWMPIDQIAAVIRECVELRRQLIQDVYEITGISDIMRGATEAQETLGAQQLKAQFGSVRVKERQAEMQRLARDVFRIQAEIMAEHFPPEVLLDMAQVDDIPSDADIQGQIQQGMQAIQQQMMALMQQPDQEAAQQQAQQLEQEAQAKLQELQNTVTIEKVVALLRDQRMRPFSLEVETDSTIEPDQIAEKQARAEFAGAMGPMMQQVTSAMQLAPQMAPLLAEFVRFMVSGFKVPRSMDEAIDKFAEDLEGYQPPPQQGGEDPEAAQMQAQAEMAKAQAASEAAQAKAQEASGKVELMKAELGIKQLEAQLEGQKIFAEIEKLQAEIQKIFAEIGMKQREAQVREQEAATDMALAERGAQLDEQRAQGEEARAERQVEMAAEKQAGDMKRADQQAKLAERKTDADMKRADKQLSMKKDTK